MNTITIPHGGREIEFCTIKFSRGYLIGEGELGDYGSIHRQIEQKGLGTPTISEIVSDTIGPPTLAS